MKGKETSLKRLTFQGVINVEQEKLPEKSRSKSKTRSKASSITKGNLSMTNRSLADAYKTNKVESKSSKKIQDEDSSSRAGSDSIFRSTKRNAEQEIMKKIIKLKNQTTQLERTLKEAEAGRQPPGVLENKQNSKDSLKLEEMQNFLEEFDAEIRKQSKQIGEFYLKQLDELDSQSERKQLEMPQFKPLAIPRAAPAMPALEAKLKQLENMLGRGRK